MKLNAFIGAVLMLIAVTASSFADDPVKPSPHGKPLSFVEQTERALQQEEEADFVVWYSTDEKLDIGVGNTDKKRNLHHPITFTLEELEGFFSDQKHKELIVVGIEKHAWTDDELRRHVEKLRDFFVARGYARIVIQQAYGSGRGIHLEHAAWPKPEQAGVDQSAAAAIRKRNDPFKHQSEGGGGPPRAGGGSMAFGHRFALVGRRIEG